MRDTELYRHLLGLLEPWTVDRVELNVTERRVDVWASHPAGVAWSCPDCAYTGPIRDHAEERTWRHLDSCHFQTYLHARIPRVACPTHKVRQVRVPWAEPDSRFTRLLERLAIDLLLECDVSGAAGILGLSWDEAWGIQERAVKRGQARKGARVVTQIGVDEKAAAKGHRYLTLVCDLEQGTVEHIADDRKQASLDSYFTSLSEAQRSGIEAMAMDMWDPYIQSALDQVPEAAQKIVFDRFHIMGHMGKAVDTVRKQEHRARRARGDETLTGTKYLWLYAEEHLPDKHRDRFATLTGLNLKVGRAWAIKESLRELWGQATSQRAEGFWRRWFWWATHSRLAPVREVAWMIKRHWANIVTYFRHGITNAVSEGLNSKIQTIKKMAYGFRNKDHFKTAIYFHCGGLDLYPR
jgi:transposase